MNKLVDIYLMADKYDIPILRQSTTRKLSLFAHSNLRTSRANGTSIDPLVDCIARICGPDSLQAADSAMKTRVMEICQRNSIALLKDRTFVQRYRRGELFDVGSATAFGMALGGLLLKSNGNPAEEADGFPNIKSVYHYTPERYVRKVISLSVFKTDGLTKISYMINFFNDQRLSDIIVTFSGKKILSHKIILATHSSYFQEVLGGSPTVSKPITHSHELLGSLEGRSRRSTSALSTTLLLRQPFWKICTRPIVALLVLDVR